MDYLNQIICCNRPSWKNGTVVPSDPYVDKVTESKFGESLVTNLPMPDQTEVDGKFSTFLNELDLSDEKRTSLNGLEIDKKWLLLCEEQNRNVLASCSPGDLTTILGEWETVMSKSSKNTHLCAKTKAAVNLKIVLRTKPNSFIRQFIEAGGYDALFSCLTIVREQSCNRQLEVELLLCVKSLLSNSHGEECAKKDHKILYNIIENFRSAYMETRTTVLNIISAYCLANDAHRVVLDAFSHFCQFSGEAKRFQRLVFGLCDRCLTDKTTLNYNRSALSLINMLLQAGSNEAVMIGRIKLRWEFISLGLQNQIEKMKLLDCPFLDNHIEYFEMALQEDDEYMVSKNLTPTSDSDDQLGLMQTLDTLTKDTATSTYFQDMLRNLQLFPVNNVAIWRTLAKISSVLSNSDFTISGENQTSVETDPGFNVRDYEIERLIMSMCLDYYELEKVQLQLDDMQRDIDSSEDGQRIESWSLDESNDQGRRLRASKGFLHDDDDGIDCRTPTDLQSSLGSASPRSDDDRKVGVPPAPPPPPPPPMLGLLPLITEPPLPICNKNIPKSSQRLKCFHWSAIPQNRISDSVWSESNDEKLYGIIDLSKVDQMFATSSKDEPDVPAIAEGYGTIQRLRKRQAETISIIDARRAQNLNILLTRHKLSNKQIIDAIQAMDQTEILSKDMIEQLLKYIPSAEELSLLAEYQSQQHKLSLSEQYMLACDQISRYEQRVHCLNYIKRFADRKSDIVPKLESINKASISLMNSKRFKKALELVLALGNYLNQGRRGAIPGFPLSILQSLTDFKSPIHKEYSLMNLIVELSEKKIPDLLRMRRELASVCDAAKISMSDLQAEHRSLKAGVSLVQKELQYHKDHDSSDAFLTVESKMTSCFIPELQIIESLFDEMTTNFELCVKQFGGADTGHSTPEEFFGPVVHFLTRFSECYRKTVQTRQRDDRRFLTLQKTKSTSQANHAKQNRTILRSDSTCGGRYPVMTGTPQDWRAEILSKRASKNGGFVPLRNGKLVSVELDSKEQLGEKSKDFDYLVQALQSGELFSSEINRLRRSVRRPPRGKKEKSDKLKESSQLA